MMKINAQSRALIAAAMFSFCGGAAFAADPPGTLLHRFSFPTRAATKPAPQVIDITIDVNGKPVEKRVLVTDIPAWVEPRRNVGELIAAWHDRVAASRAEASRVKAARIAEAINQAFAAEFKAIGQVVTVDVYEVADRQYNNRKGFYGMIKIPSVKEAAVKDKKLYNWVNNQTAEPRGDSLGFERGGSSMGIKGAMGRPTSGLTTFATGTDAYGEQSMVSLGISDLYVADYVPSFGMSDGQVLQSLGAALTRHGIPTTFNSSLSELVIDMAMFPGQELIWGNSDPTLDLSVFLLAIPEPAQFALLGIGILLVVFVVRRARYAKT